AKYLEDRAPSLKINVMVFDRASKVEYDAWAKLGNPGWDWNGLLPNMKNAERFTGIDPFRANYTNADPTSIFPSQGRNGPVAGSYNNWYGDITVPFFKSMANLSIPTNFDPDSGNAYGVFNSATSVNRTTGKPTKINFKDKNSDKSENVVATGVSFVHKSQTYTVKAKKEVILAAGAFQSPQLLELSGIGNATILKNYGIKPLVDLPGLKPGSSFQDMDTLRNNATFAAAAAAQYLWPLSAEIANLTAQLDREIASEKLTPLEKASYKIQKEWLKEKVGLVEVIMNPGYAGSMRRKPTLPTCPSFRLSNIPSRAEKFSNPLVVPRIDPNYFSKSIGTLAALARGFADAGTDGQIWSQTLENRAFGIIGSERRKHSSPIGTAALAPKEIGGVVDVDLKSIWDCERPSSGCQRDPLHIGTHIQRTVYGIAEKAANIIKGQS
ncbi:alcohol oxidase, partial [Rhizoctonia solani]